MSASVSRSNTQYSVEIRSDFGEMTKRAIIDFAQALADAGDVPDDANVHVETAGFAVRNLRCRHVVTVKAEAAEGNEGIEAP